MGQALQWIRSLIFNASMYVAMLVLAVAFFPFALFSTDWAFRGCKTYCRYVIWSAGWMVGLKTEIRGTPPTDPVVVAAKHQSFYDILVIFNALPRPRFIMKHILLFAPILGQYAWRIGAIPVHRGKRGQAIQKMIEEVQRGDREPGQLVIYPQGTRVAPGLHRPYKVGSGALYKALEQDCVPVATNIGVFWPKRGVMRKPGTAVVEFLPRIPAGEPLETFMPTLETVIESASDALNAEAGFHAPTR